MSKEGMPWFAALAALLLGMMVIVAGCETKGPVQQAGENIDKGIQNAKDAINPPGPAEKAGRRSRQGPQQVTRSARPWAGYPQEAIRPASTA